jgi:uncharacterized membrane protein YfcA
LIDATTLYVLAVILVATLIRSTFGFGEALVAVPLLALRIPVAVAAPVSVLVSVSVAGLIVAQDWRQIEMRSASWLIASALLGIPLGLLLLTLASDHTVRLLLGLVIVGFSLYSIGARTKLHLETDHLAWLLGAGFCSGILGGAYGMNGPPLAIYGALRRWSPQRFRATLQGYFLAASLAQPIHAATSRRRRGRGESLSPHGCTRPSATMAATSLIGMTPRFSAMVAPRKWCLTPVSPGPPSWR